MYTPPSIICLYTPENLGTLDIEEIAGYVREKFRVAEVKVREEFLSFFLSLLAAKEREEKIEKIAEKLARARVRDIRKKNAEIFPLPAEIEHEKRLMKKESRAFGILYDGIKLSNIYMELIAAEEKKWSYCHIVFTNRLFGTWDESDKRYHARVSIYSFPSLISTTGIVEAPAKPRDFYLKLQMGFDINFLKKEYKGRFIDYDDERMTEVMKGYVMQAIFFHTTGEAFCNDENCRLFNAHWQEEVIKAQIESEYEFCPKHRKMLEEINERIK
jgi:hypothetical protein